LLRLRRFVPLRRLRKRVASTHKQKSRYNPPNNSHVLASLL
jgi:hypothetical protein